MSELVRRYHHLELQRIHSLQAHHLGFEHPAAARCDPMSCLPAARDARRNTIHRLPEAGSRVAIDDHVDLRWVRPLAPKLPLNLDHVEARIRLCRRRERTGDGRLGLRFQEVRELRTWDRLWKSEAPPICVLADANDISADAMVRNSMIFCVHEPGRDVIQAQRGQGLHDCCEVPPVVDLLQSSYVLEHENPRFLPLDVVQNIEENRTTTAQIFEALSQPS
mmetsp:Transcript_34350/g.99764  ORF Transcript_34350/g.99764 Transcript_34350/m.99764 type:complete len:221 (-) Transcript_34350:315-977(-)